MKTICITGVNGFLGSAGAAAFLSAGYKVIGIDRSAERSQTVPAAVTYYCADINDTEVIEKIFMSSAIDMVLHHAGIKYVGICEAEPERCNQVNYEGTVSILAAMATAKIPHIVFSSTYLVVGDITGKIVELTEQSPQQPSTFYGKAKAASEEAIVAAHKAGKIQTYHILRYGNIIGRILRGSFKVESIVDRIVDAALHGTSISLLGTDHDTKDGTIARDFIDVRDVIAAHLAVVENVTSGTYNIANGKTVTLREIITAVEKASGKIITVEVKPATVEPDSVTVISQAAYEAFGWRAEKTLDDTIQQLVAIATSTAD